jgi:hypothetical protein
LHFSLGVRSLAPITNESVLTSPDHDQDQPQRSLAMRVVRNAARGSVIGVAVTLLIYAQQTVRVARTSDRMPLGFALVAGILLGPVVSLTLMATRSWRKDLVGQYASCVLAGIVAGLALGGMLMLEDPASPGLAFGLGAFLGLCGGLGLGVFYRRWHVDDESARP